MRLFSCASLFLVTAACLLVPPVRAADLACDGVGYVWALSPAGSPPWVFRTLADNGLDVAYGFSRYVSDVFPGLYTVTPCSSSPVVDGTTCALYKVDGTFVVTGTIAKLCSPSPRVLSNSGPEALQMLLVLGSVALWGIGFATGVQR